MAGRAAFFAPETCTAPFRGTPPSMRILSMWFGGRRILAVRAAPSHLFVRSCVRPGDDETREPRQVAPHLRRGEAGLAAEPRQRLGVALVHLEDERAAGDDPARRLRDE